MLKRAQLSQNVHFLSELAFQVSCFVLVNDIAFCQFINHRDYFR